MGVGCLLLFGVMAFQSLKDGQEIQNSLTLFLFLNKSFFTHTPS